MGFELGVGIVAALGFILLFLYYWANTPEPSQVPPRKPSQKPPEPRKRPKDDPAEPFWKGTVPGLGDDVTVQIRNRGKDPSQEQLAQAAGLAEVVRRYDEVLGAAIAKAIDEYEGPKPKLRLVSVRLDTRPEVLELHYQSEVSSGYGFSVFVTVAHGKVAAVLFAD